MSIFIVSGNNLPENTHLIMGSFQNIDGEKTVDIDVHDIIDPIKLAVYNAFFLLVGQNVSVEIINSPHVGEFNHVTPNAVELNAIVIDYLLLNVNEKQTIDDAFVLLANA